MYWDTKFVKPLPDYRIYVEIENGCKGIFDMKPHLDRASFVSFGMCITSTRLASCSAQQA